MKYLKLFENLDDVEPCYYRMPYGNISDFNLIKMSVKKMPVNLYIKTKIIEILETQLNRRSYDCIYLLFKKNINSKDEDWGFWGISLDHSEADLNALKEFVKKNNITFKGDIMPEPYEISADKYNL